MKLPAKSEDFEFRLGEAKSASSSEPWRHVRAYCKHIKHRWLAVVGTTIRTSLRTNLILRLHYLPSLPEHLKLARSVVLCGFDCA